MLEGCFVTLQALWPSYQGPAAQDPRFRVLSEAPGLDAGGNWVRWTGRQCQPWKWIRYRTTGLSGDCLVNHQEHQAGVSTSFSILWRGPKGHRQKEYPRQLSSSAPQREHWTSNQSEVVHLNPSSDTKVGKLVKFSELQLPHLQNEKNTYHPIGLQED